MKVMRPGRDVRVGDFRTFLSARLRAAKKRNPRFSLRAFARRLGVDHSTLSQILRGKRRLTGAQALRMGKRLGLAAEAIQEYARDLETGPVPKTRGRARRLSFDAETFALVAIWHHCAILELTRVDGFTTDSRWIAKTLGLSVAEVNVALQRLLRLRLLEMNDRRRWVDTSGDVELRGTGVSPDLRKQLTRQPHDLAIEAIERAPAARQVHDQMIVAIDSRQLPALAWLVDAFMSDLRAMTADRRHDEVYQAVVSLVPLTHVNNGRTR